MALEWKTGFEIELLAPRGRSRLDLARRVADRHGGQVRRFFHPQAELASVKGKPVFENLTPGFEVLDGLGKPVARFVDDLTLLDGLDQTAPSLPAWYRLVTDDRRLVSLLLHNCDPDAALSEVLVPIASLFGSALERHESGMVKVSDERGASIAIGSGLPGERERGCEIVTPPIESLHLETLDDLLADARREACTIPLEAATHVHFDATPLRTAVTIARLVNVLGLHGTFLKKLVGSNPNCRRLGNWPDALFALVNQDGFQDLDWPAARKELANVGLVKFCDFNLLNIATENKVKHTFEVRVLPVSFETASIIRQAELFAGILRWCVDGRLPDRATDDDYSQFWRDLPMSMGEGSIGLAGEDSTRSRSEPALKIG